MRIAVTGGKGGTGKSTIATALAVELARKKRVMLFDADVDCPNDYTILSVKRKEIETVRQMIPRFDLKKCTKCGLCSKVCMSNAILQIKGEYPVLIPDQCNGCGSCLISCPEGAISRSSKKIGTIYEGENMGVRLVMGELIPNQPISEFVVGAAKRVVDDSEKSYDHVITDTAAGTHCDVISALSGNDLALVVTEPTPLGAHDGELILQLLKLLGIPAKIVLNRSDIGKQEIVEAIAEKFGTEIISRIPYKKSILDSYSKGEPIKDGDIEKLAKEVVK
ncbi:MAG: ATP-binding protein [Candidatus Aenigmarchaeota archaeon]|nr:ATP-binding protein [Candidatus Aenigmarchaeota archaeon]